ncbi:hypothetical protein [Spirosoma montaniterrae]|uniref:Uncharacterized protein n=1 Tax=Spirosoma montaniterrae TaxID=1178516 RepID=A0A1P9WV10_9BACT|nr:hypothetical protein [Spirosoma montaniterrae]AQG79214.1 hypothetical protein AWR27_07670 [Spirosoma montaniterrae]
MMLYPVWRAYSPYSPSSAQTRKPRNQPNRPFGDEPPRQPDWLLIMVGILFLLTLLVAWLAGVPVLDDNL